MTTPRLSIHDRLTDLADATRCRILLALESHELTVGELCAALQLPQSTVSRHLKILADERWLTSRADGASRWYSISTTLDPAAESLWKLVREPLASTAAADQDLARVDSVLTSRRARSEAFFAAAAPDWDSTRSTLFGQRADLSALLALLDPNWTVGDLGCGTGTLTAAIAPHVQFVHAVDASPPMLAAARERLNGVTNVSLSTGALETLPLNDGSLDIAIMLLVLHHVAEPSRALAEVQRVLKPTGRLLIVDMRAHTHEEYRQQMGHVWLGFDESALTSWLTPAGFTAPRYVPLPVEPNATGPALFAATATPMSQHLMDENSSRRRADSATPEKMNEQQSQRIRDSATPDETNEQPSQRRRDSATPETMDEHSSRRIVDSATPEKTNERPSLRLLDFVTQENTSVNSHEVQTSMDGQLSSQTSAAVNQENTSTDTPAVQNPADASQGRPALIPH